MALQRQREAEAIREKEKQVAEEKKKKWESTKDVELTTQNTL